MSRLLGSREAQRPRHGFLTWPKAEMSAGLPRLRHVDFLISILVVLWILAIFAGIFLGGFSLGFAIFVLPLVVIFAFML